MPVKKKHTPKVILEFTTAILQFGEKGEKTGWTYIEIPTTITQQLKPANKKSFRVKGKLDNFSISGIALIPMGGGRFIMAINAEMRKGIGKRKGTILKVLLQTDENFKIEMPPELLICLADEPSALSNYNTLSPSHRAYFIKWIISAKTEETKATRIAHCITAMIRNMDYGQMIRELKKEKDELMK